jgi:hypothetical protein
MSSRNSESVNEGADPRHTGSGAHLRDVVWAGDRHRDLIAKSDPVLSVRIGIKNIRYMLFRLISERGNTSDNCEGHQPRDKRIVVGGCTLSVGRKPASASTQSFLSSTGIMG